MTQNKTLNAKYLNNGYFYLTCNCCDRLILNIEMDRDEHDKNGGYCPECIEEQKHEG